MVQLNVPIAEIIDYCLRHDIRSLALFGSALRDELRTDSDVDLLVDFRPQAVVGLFRLAQMESELSEMFGRRVDLRTAAELSPYFREEVLQSARVLYAEG